MHHKSQSKETTMKWKANPRVLRILAKNMIQKYKVAYYCQLVMYETVKF